jgi:hypothetical protein
MTSGQLSRQCSDELTKNGTAMGEPCGDDIRGVSSFLGNSLAGWDNVKVTRAVAGCVIAFGVAACTALFGPTWAYQPGSIAIGSIVVPDTVTVRTDFMVTFNTQGGGCTKAGYTKALFLDNLTVEIRPYDSYQVHPSACTTILAIYPHAMALQFGQTGIATLRLIGAYNDSTITITRTVVVR